MSGNLASNKAEAPGQAAGYVFQLRYALHRALERLKRDPTASIAIEKHDDVSIISDIGVEAVDQLKHTIHEEGELGDYSKAIWRTIGNWLRLIDLGAVELTRVEFLLVTNATLPTESALSFLCVDEAARDIKSALKMLQNIAQSSTNKDTKVDREAFLKLYPSEQLAFLQAIRVADESPSLGALTTEIEASVCYACERDQVAEFRQELEGWWIEITSTSLAKGQGPIIPLTELDARIAFLREKYRASSLHIDAMDIQEGYDHLNGYIFVEQVRSVNANETRIKNAQRNFLRASAQRSKWLRTSKIDPAELRRYDDDLQDKWEARFAIAGDELAPDAAEEEKCKVGRALLGWAETLETPLKGASAQFLTSGSFHALADEVRVGWHPEYIKKFKTS